MNFLSTFEAPIAEMIDGVEVKFPVLKIDDYTDWVSELTAKFKQEKKQKINSIASTPSSAQLLANPEYRAELEHGIDMIELGLEAVATKVGTLAGSKRILSMSLKKSEIPEADHAEIIARVRPHRLHRLAAEVSALFPKIERKAEKPSPNDVPPATCEIAGNNAIG